VVEGPNLGEEEKDGDGGNDPGDTSESSEEHVWSC
jgi:hypothetical protein